MRKMKILPLVLVLLVSPLASADISEQGKEIFEQLRSQKTDPAAMQAWMKTTEMGLPHEFLEDAFVGEWKTTTKMYMDPEGEPMTSTGTAIVKPIFGGKFIEETYQSTMMGQPYSGRSTVGYDNTRKLFVSSWVDSMSTGISQMHGSIGPDGKTMTFVGDMNEPMSGEMGKAFKFVISIESEDRHVAKMYEVLYGDPFVVMEITYERKPADE